MSKDLTKEDNTRQWEPKKLWSRQKEVLRLLASGLCTQKEIAKMLDITPESVNALARSELGRATIEMYDGAADHEAVTVMARLKALAPIALTVQEEMLLDETTPNRLKNDLANKVLDRAGFAPVQRNVSLNVSAGLTAEDLENIKNRAREIEEIHAEVVNDEL